MAMRSSPNGLGLNARFLDYLRTVHGLDFWAVLNNPKIKIPGLFSDSPELNCETEFWTVHAYGLVYVAKMNNMCLCENYFVNACSMDVLT